MKRAPLTYNPPRRSREQLARLRQIERDFHVRAFGEELARVNLDFTIEERIRYLGWMRELARQNGVPEEKRFPFYLEDAPGEDEVDSGFQASVP